MQPVNNGLSRLGLLRSSTRVPYCPPFSGAVPRYYYSLTSPPMLAPHCTGYESSLFNCAQSVCHIENYNYAGVECSPGKISEVSSIYM